ncbi:hypothetical protein BK816_08170 [Boudabousia tangfeifanii]|uniref:Uncharacterized protein n=1 Tax=Boudabousia tangfeifanii TaxID=1912795 RepID=A0A1D9MLT9_9ACTO|nr:hypothetical protein [Boudabousia tangfeifanii]AOZ73262.1 hypothetical protein BK816_08170 [Boudabousia tangfeifanii]
MTDELFPNNDSKELQMFEDEHGVVLLGEPTQLETWLNREGIDSREFHLKPNNSAGKVAKVSQLAGKTAELSGRWVKKTKESTELVKKLGRTQKVGSMADASQKVSKLDRLKRGVASPSLLTGVGGVMAQIAREQAIKEISDYLKQMDSKLEDLLQDQKDQAVSNLLGVAQTIKETEAIAFQTGQLSETTWSKLSQAPQNLATARAYALVKLDGLTRKLETAKNAGAQANAAEKLQKEINVWLAVVAQSLVLHDRISVLEIQRAMGENPKELADYQSAMEVARRLRLTEIEEVLNSLNGRLAAAARVTSTQKLLHPKAVGRTLPALAASTSMVNTFAHHVELELNQAEIKDAPGWFQAASEVISATANDAAQLGVRAATGTKTIAGDSWKYLQKASTNATKASVDLTKNSASKLAQWFKELGANQENKND